MTSKIVSDSRSHDQSLGLRANQSSKPHLLHVGITIVNSLKKKACYSLRHYQSYQQHKILYYLKYYNNVLIRNK